MPHKVCKGNLKESYDNVLMSYLRAFNAQKERERNIVIDVFSFYKSFSIVIETC